MKKRKIEKFHKIGKNSKLKKCIFFSDCEVGEDVVLENVVNGWGVKIAKGFLPVSEVWPLLTIGFKFLSFIDPADLAPAPKIGPPSVLSVIWDALRSS